jgi:hypothetical protein
MSEEREALLGCLWLDVGCSFSWTANACHGGIDSLPLKRPGSVQGEPGA